MRVGRRVAAGLCAFVLALSLVAFPVRAKAAATAALTAVGAAITVSAFLSLCGIHPYISGNQSFGEWGAQSLADLWQEFKQSHTTQVVWSNIKAFVVGNVLAYPKVTWEGLREFAQWIVEKFSVTDNQAGQDLGELVPPLFLVVPRYNRYSSFIGVATQSSLSLVTESGETLYFGATYRMAFSLLSLSSGTYFFVIGGSNYNRENFFTYNSSTAQYSCEYYDVYSPNASPSAWLSVRDNCRVGGVDYRIPGIPCYTSVNEAKEAYSRFDWETVTATFAGIKADTSVVSVPGALNPDSKFAGIRAKGVPATAEPEAVASAIQQGVEMRAQPLVELTEVEVAEGVDVDTNTGEVTAEDSGTVVISPDVVPLVVSDYAIPGISSLFPFSIPWDIARVWQALDAEPRFPLQDFSLTLDIPLLFGDAPPSVRFDLESMPQARQKIDEVAGIVRACLLLVACIGFLVFIGSFLKF